MRVIEVLPIGVGQRAAQRVANGDLCHFEAALLLVRLQLVPRVAKVARVVSRVECAALRVATSHREQHGERSALHHVLLRATKGPGSGRLVGSVLRHHARLLHERELKKAEEQKHEDRKHNRRFDSDLTAAPTFRPHDESVGTSPDFLNRSS